MPPRGRKSTTAVAVYVAETPPLDKACASEGAPGDEYDYKEVEPAVPALALTSTPHDIAERAAAAVRLDKMRKARDAALEDREKLQEFVAELQAKLEESRNEATQARKTGGKLIEENGSLKQKLKKVEVLHTNAMMNERNRTLFHRTRKETMERAWVPTMVPTWAQRGVGACRTCAPMSTERANATVPSRITRARATQT